MTRRPKKQTRGRRSKGDRILPSTTGNTEITADELSDVLNSVAIALDKGAFVKLLALINSRASEVTNTHLDWDEAGETVTALVASCKETARLLRQTSQLGDNDVGRPHGNALLSSLDYDFNDQRAYQKMSWVDAEAWLVFMSENLEAEFVPHGGRTGLYYDFIHALGIILDSAGVLGDKPIRGVQILADAIEENWPGFVYPPHTLGFDRHSYIHNVRRARKGW